ncbi:NUDIX domain-containing protein [Crossiella sp. SN42]|uniref:NUDIX hydrolase n=1 Tax=Crossiella sp. SN42 TaxID=2944808 RepID=UPI00207C2041|nr:NUDIX domain-containing protein [Crossiella sp. SN42]MCO1577678.1 NUDIX domain-containing protein [Crossiella sp. SN42]
MASAPRYSVSVAGVVVDGAGRVLVIRRRDNGRWEPPGGVLEVGETFEQGVRREVCEETGIVVRVERLTGVYQNVVRDVVALVFRCSPETTEPVPTEEASEVRWLSLEQVREVMVPAFAIRVADAFGEGPRTRVHDGVRLLG